jgi:hypothetical protein
MSTNFNEDDFEFEEFEESNNPPKEDEFETVIEPPEEPQVNLKELELKLILDFKDKFLINDQLFYDDDYETIKTEFDSFGNDNLPNQIVRTNSNKITSNIKANFFHLDIEKSNQFNLWGSIPHNKSSNAVHEVSFRVLDYNELIGLSKRFERNRRNKKKPKSILASTVSNSIIRKLYLKFIELKNLYLNLSNVSLDSFFKEKVINANPSNSHDNLKEFDFIEDLQQNNEQLEFKKSSLFNTINFQEGNGKNGSSCHTLKKFNEYENIEKRCNLENVKETGKRNVSCDIKMNKGANTIDHTDHNFNISIKKF